MSEELFDDEETSSENGKKSGPRYLPSKTTIKDDLQEIYDTERQIGSAVFKLHQLIGQVQETLGKKADSEEVSEGLEDLNLYLETNSKAVQDRLAEIKAAADVFTNHLAKIDNDWLRVQRAHGSKVPVPQRDSRAVNCPDDRLVLRLKHRRFVS